MPLSNKFEFIAPSLIMVLRETRQRQADLSTDDLEASILRHGIINPLVVNRDFVLKAGERRLIAALKLGLAVVPVRYLDELSEIEAQVLELEENLKRKDLHWRDEVRAIGQLHSLYRTEDPTWTVRQTSEALGLSASHMAVILRVSAELSNPRIAQATGVNSAYNALIRVDQRAIADAMNDIIDVGRDDPMGPDDGEPDAPDDDDDAVGPILPPDPDRAPTGTDQSTRPAPKPRILPAEASILQARFLEWAPKYAGPRFNLVHCDFPYGINFNTGDQSGKNEWQSYDDSPDVYWALCKCLCENLDRIMAPSAHLVFWFSMEHYQPTLDFFAKHAPGLEFQKFPLIWTKSDNVGLLPDPKRGPRRIYETALIASREDRLIIRSVSNAHHSPTEKSLHQSTKPEPMLRQFFQMFVDQHTRMLDPTCGGGSSLRAAESLGASYVLGLEISEDSCAAARTALRQFRLLREVSK